VARDSSRSLPAGRAAFMTPSTLLSDGRSPGRLRDNNSSAAPSVLAAPVLAWNGVSALPSEGGAFVVGTAGLLLWSVRSGAPFFATLLLWCPARAMGNSCALTFAPARSSFCPCLRPPLLLRADSFFAAAAPAASAPDVDAGMVQSLLLSASVFALLLPLTQLLTTLLASPADLDVTVVVLPAIAVPARTTCSTPAGSSGSSGTNSVPTPTHEVSSSQLYSFLPSHE
jgi:hypothetical protein